MFYNIFFFFFCKNFKKNNMKKIVIYTIAALVVLSFTQCEKVHIKNGDKRIIGTWKITTFNTKSESYEKEDYKYTPEIGYYENNFEEETEREEITWDGTNLTTKYYGKVNDNGDIDTEDTTFTEKFEGKIEITFNEDGTGRWVEKDDNYNQDYSFRWNWIDASEDKIGVQIIRFGYNYKGFTTDEYIQTFYFKEITKDNMIIEENFDASSKSTYTNKFDYNYYNENTNSWEYYEIIKVRNLERKSSIEGTYTMTKQ